MRTTIWYGTSRLANHKYEPVIIESAVESRYEAEPQEFEGIEEPMPAGWYITRPTGPAGGAGYELTTVDGPYESEEEAYANALAEISRAGWVLTREAAEAAANEQAQSRRKARRQRQQYTADSAVELLVAAGIFEPGWSISDRVWNKPHTKQRVQLALRGDKCAAGCLRRDAIKSH